MTDQTTTTETPEETGKGLRAQLEASLAREKTLRTTILNDAYDTLKLDTKTGLGKAIAKEYEGEASLDALSAYAHNEYGYTPKEDQPEVNPLVAVIGEEQERLDTVGSTAGSVSTPTQAELLAKAEAEGDVQTSMAIKSAQVAAMFQ